MQTLFDLAKDVRLDKKSMTKTGEGLTPIPFDKVEGYRIVSPEALASLQVPTVKIDENIKTIEGFQRTLNEGRARKIARALARGIELPPVLVSIDEHGNALITDGQHRAVGAIMARRPLGVVVQTRSKDHARELFANQKLGQAPNNDFLIISGSGPLAEYIQDALTNDRHPWAELVGPGKAGGAGKTTKMSPSQASMLLSAYVGNQAGIRSNFFEKDESITSRWDRDTADELAQLISCFGDRKSNPLAFRSNALRAIGITATLAIRRQDNHAANVKRWKQHMSKFQFGLYAHLPAHDLTDSMIAYWNKYLRDENQIRRPRS